MTKEIVDKSTYLVILYILFEKGMKFLPLQVLGEDGFFIIIVVYLFIGRQLYRNSERKSISKVFSNCIRWIFIAFFLSMISAWVYYGQSIIQSLITYRVQYLMVTPILMAQMNISKNDIIKSLHKYIWIFTIAYIIRIVYPGLFEISDTFIEGDAVALTGYVLLTIPLYFTLQELSIKINVKKILIITLILVLIFLQENRSTLFPVLLLTCWMFLKNKSRYKGLLITGIIIVGTIAMYQIWDTLQLLIAQTQEELSNPAYNRNKAFIYFLQAFSPNLWCIIFGNGYLSNHSTPIMQLLMDQGIYNSDLGFIGYWNQFGLIPIIVFLYLYLSAIFKTNVSLYIKALALQSLICGLTISYFGSLIYMIFFILFFYLYFLDISAHRTIKHARK